MEVIDSVGAHAISCGCSKVRVFETDSDSVITTVKDYQ